MSVDELEDVVLCEVCGSEGSRRYLGHNRPTGRHPLIVDSDAKSVCLLCGLDESILHDGHNMMAALMEQRGP